jgi:hypothetical protein
MERLAVPGRQRMRLGELARQWFRRERVFDRAGRWYFRTREGIDVGPYASRFEAEIESDILTARLSRDSAAHSIRIIRSFLMESVRQRSADASAAPSAVGARLDIGSVITL